jgi:hypothetical protein
MRKIVETYQLDYRNASVKLRIPAGAELLTVRTDRREELSLYAIVDKDQAEEETRTFAILGTNDAIPSDDRVYIGSATSGSSHFLWHVFEIFERKN